MLRSWLRGRSNATALVIALIAGLAHPGIVIQTADATTSYTWAPASSLTARYGHTATELADGRILVAGGRTSEALDSGTNSVQIYDPTTGTWSAGAPMLFNRAFAGAIRLDGPTCRDATVEAWCGSVLVFGGIVSNPNTSDLSDISRSAEMYDPDTKLWTRTGDYSPPENGYSRLMNRTAVRLDGPNCGANCNKVLLVGGADSPIVNPGSVSSELFDPTTATFSPTAPLNFGRKGTAAAVLLVGPNCGVNCNKVLVAGGYNDPAPAELYDPQQGSWALTGTTLFAHKGNTTTALADGKVLVAGNPSPGIKSLATPEPGPAELYDPSTGTFSPTGSMARSRFLHTATALPSGDVLAVGGGGDTSPVFDTAEVYDAKAVDPLTGIRGIWRDVTPHSSRQARAAHTATLLSNGRVLVAGGASDLNVGGAGPALGSAQLFGDVQVIRSLSVTDAAVAEGTPGAPGHTPGKARFTVSLSVPATTDVTVEYKTADGTAKGAENGEGGDYTKITTGTLIFSANQTSQVVEVPVTMDSSSVEGDEDFFLNLSNPSGAVLADPQGKATIYSDDPASTATLSVSEARVTEGVAGTTTQAVFTVKLERPFAAPFTVRAVTADGTAHPLPHESNDYVHLNQILSFARDEMTKQVAVTINGDNIDERDETFFLALEDSTGPQREKRQGVGVIVNDDGLPPMSIDDVTIAEGNVGPTEARFTISLGHSSFRPISVNYSTADGTARSTNHGMFGPADYNPAVGTVSFAPGDTTKTVVVTVNGDTLKEQDEQFVVNLSNNVNATAVKRVGVGTIINDD